MKRKTVFLIVIAVVFLLALGIFLFSKTETSSRYTKNLIERSLSFIPNFEINIGSIEILPKLRMEDVKVKIAGEHFLTIERLSTNYSVNFISSLLFRKKLYLSDTEIDGLDLLLKKDKTGMWNFKKLKRTESETKPENPNHARTTLVFSDTTIRDSHVLLVDQQRERKWEFDLVQESLFSVSIVELKKRVELAAESINFNYVSPEIKIRNLRGKIDFESWNCMFSDSGFTLEGIPMRGDGIVRNLKKPDFDMTVYLDSLQLGSVAEINIAAETKVKMHSLDDLDGTVEISAEGSSLYEEELFVKTDPVTIKGTKAIIRGKAQRGSAESEFSGEIDLRKWLAKEQRNFFNISAIFKSPEAERIIEMINRSPYPLALRDTATLDADLVLNGSWENKQKYLLRVESERFDISDGEDGILELKGSLTFANDHKEVDIFSRANGFAFESAIGEKQFGGRLNGDGSVFASLAKKTRFLENAEIKIDAGLTADAFFGMTDFNSEINAEIKNGAITIKEGLITSQEFSFSSKRIENAEKTLDCSFEFISKKADFLSVFGIKHGVLGMIRSNGRISGTVFSPLVEATSEIENFSYNQDIFAQKATMRLHTQLSAKDFSIVSADIDVLAEKAHAYGNSADLVEAKFRETDGLSEIEINLTKEDGSFISGDITAENLFSDKKEITITSLSGLLNEKELKSGGDVTVYVSPNKTSFSGERFVYAGGVVSSYSGEINNTEDQYVALRADIENFDPFILSKGFNFPHDLRGAMNGRIEISGPLRAISTDIELSSYDLFYGSQIAERVVAKLRGKNGTLYLELDAFENSKQTIDIKGDLKFSKNSRDIAELLKSAKFELELSSTGHGIGFTKIFSGSIKKIEGIVFAEDFSLSGSFFEPRLKGKAEVRDFEIAVTQLRNSFSAQNARLFFNGKRLRLEKTEITSKNGKAWLWGDMDIPSFTFSADAKMENIHFNPHTIKTNISGNIHLEKGDEFLEITGDVGIDPTRIRLYPGRTKTIRDIRFINRNELYEDEFSLEERSSAGFYMEKTGLDISVKIPSGSWIKTREANFNTDGKIRLIKQPGSDIEMQGNIVSREGYYTVFGKLFDIQDATLNFNGEMDNPSLNVNAYYDAGDVDIYVYITEDLRTPELSLSSSPPLEQIDIVSYIVFGRPSSNLRTNQRNFMGEFATAVAAGGLSEIIGSEIGLSVLNIHEGEQGLEDSSLEVGSYFTKDIFVSYERSPSTTSLDETLQMRNKVNLEWRIDKRFSLESQIGGENPGVDFFYNFDF